MANPAAIHALLIPDSGLGLRADGVELVEHDKRWSGLFQEAAREIVAALDDDEARVEHIGSTSVSGLAAKPVLDIAVGLHEPIAKDSVTAKLAGIGFDFQADLGMYGGLMFTVSSPSDLVVANLHVVDINDFQWRWYLKFRDGLRSDPDLRAEYELLKRNAAAGNQHDRAAYTKFKFDWVLATVGRLDEDVNATE